MTAAIPWGLGNWLPIFAVLVAVIPVAWVYSREALRRADERDMVRQVATSRHASIRRGMGEWDA